MSFSCGPHGHMYKNGVNEGKEGGLHVPQLANSGVIKVQVVLIHVYNLVAFNFAQVSSSFSNYGVLIELRKRWPWIKCLLSRKGKQYTHHSFV